MSPRPKGPVVRVSGLPQPDENFTDSSVLDLLKQVLEEQVLEKKTTGLEAFEQLTIELAPSCVYETEQIALVEFHNGLPNGLSELSHPKVIKTHGLDLTLDVKFDGFTQLYTPSAADEVTVDIIAITGLDCHAYDSWRSKTSGTMWLRDILSKEMPHCRTMTYGYDSKLLRKSFETIMDFSKAFLENIKNIRSKPELMHRPIIFIAHSFGGIILAQSLVLASHRNRNADPVIAALEKVIYGMLLFGVPHQGLLVDDLEAMLAAEQNPFRYPLLNQLKIGSDALSFIHEPFRELIADAEYMIVSFYETLATRRLEYDAAGKEWKRTGKHQAVVQRSSALLQLPNHMEDKIPVDADHYSIVKFDAKSISPMPIVLRYLKRSEREALCNVQDRFRTQESRQIPTTTTQPQESVMMSGDITALSVATVACQFLDYTTTLVSRAGSVHNSEPDHDDRRIWYLQGIIEDLTKLNGNVRICLKQQNIIASIQADRQVLRLGEECDRLSIRLIDTLKAVQKQATSRTQTWNSFVLAVGTLWDESDINAFAKSLRICRQRITTHLIESQRELVTAEVPAAHSESSSTRTTQRQTIEGILNAPDIMVAIQNAYTSLVSGIMSGTSPSKICEIAQFSDTGIANRQVLAKLSYQEMSYRSNRVTAAHEDTFEWFFQPPTQQESWADFSEWLKSDADFNPLYWITGKPGAGKSTLMRFLIGHKQTTKLLDTWQDEQRLLQAGFYFWNSGTPLQMSFEGLVRSLLYQILEQAPALIPIVLPHRLLDAMLFGEWILGQRSWVWSLEELMHALDKLLEEASRVYKVMIFIDGLDEFDGKPMKIIDFVKRLLKIPGVKVCASSRPWNQFRDAFEHGPHLQLERLTFGDIQKYVRATLDQSPAFSAYEHIDPGFPSRLVDEVCEKSEGVFLWVYLVAQSLLDGIADGDNSNELLNRLDNLPNDLEPLFDKILWAPDSKDPKALERASQLLQLHRHFPEPLSPPTLLFMSFADDADPAFAINAPIDGMDAKQASTKADKMRRRINACTRGLLDANTFGSADIASTIVSPLHRTVKDYLYRDDIWTRICAAAPPHFNRNARFFNCFIMRLKMRERTFGMDTYSKYASSAMSHLKRACLGAHAEAIHTSSLDKLYADVVCTSERSRTAPAFVEAAEAAWVHMEWSSVDKASIESLLTTALHCGLFTYLAQGLKSLPDLIQSVTVSECLFRIVLNDNSSHVGDLPDVRIAVPNPELVRLLLNCGGDPNYIPYGKNTVAKELLDYLEKDGQHSARHYCTILEEFATFGARFNVDQLAKVIGDVDYDTNRLYGVPVNAAREETSLPFHKVSHIVENAGTSSKTRSSSTNQTTHTTYSMMRAAGHRKARLISRWFLRRRGSGRKKMSLTS